MSSDAAASERAAKALSATDDSLPYLTTALVNDATPEHRVRAAKTVLSRLKVKETSKGREGELRPGLDMEAVTRALFDESPAVRAAALAVVNLAGIAADYQRTRLEEMQKFDALLGDLASPDDAKRKAAAETFRLAGERALPFLAGTAFSDDRDYVRRGLETLRGCVFEILKSSNQRRIVPLLERRRCGVLLAALPKLDEKDRALVTDVLNVSGRLSADFFSEFLRSWPATDAALRDKLVSERILQLESAERLKSEGADEIQKLSR
jgi:hypothetical protein